MEWAIMGAKAGGTAIQIIGAHRAGKEAKKQAARDILQLKAEEAALQRASTEKQLEIERDKQKAVGSVIAQAGKSGLRPVGSVKTLSQRVAAEHEREKRYLGSQTAGALQRLKEQQYDLYRSGKRARKAARWGAATSLLGGFGDMAQFGYERGWFS